MRTLAGVAAAAGAHLGAAELAAVAQLAAGPAGPVHIWCCTLVTSAGPESCCSGSGCGLIPWCPAGGARALLLQVVAELIRKELETGRKAVSR